MASRHNPLDERRIRAEGRGHLGGFENTEPSARPGADEHHAAALAKRGRDHLDTNRNALALALDGREHLAIFVDHEIDDFAGKACRSPGLMD